MKKEKYEVPEICSGPYRRAANDTVNVLDGKWKLPIIGSLLSGKKRFRELERYIPGITPRMLSKELKELELNGIVDRIVCDTAPMTVVYGLTPSGTSFRKVMDAMVEWGMEHRRNVLGVQE